MKAENHHSIHLRVTRELFEHLNEKSREDHCSIPETVRQLILTDYMNSDVSDREISVLNRASKEIAQELFSELTLLLNKHENEAVKREEKVNKNLDHIFDSLKKIWNKQVG